MSTIAVVLFLNVENGAENNVEFSAEKLRIPHL